MSGPQLAPSLDTPRQVAAAVALWCEKTTDSPRAAARSLMAGAAAMCAHAAARGDLRQARTYGRRFVAVERYLAVLEGVSR